MFVAQQQADGEKSLPVRFAEERAVGEESHAERRVRECVSGAPRRIQRRESGECSASLADCHGDGGDAKCGRRLVGGADPSSDKDEVLRRINKQAAQRYFVGNIFGEVDRLRGLAGGRVDVDWIPSDCDGIGEGLLAGEFFGGQRVQAAHMAGSQGLIFNGNSGVNLLTLSLADNLIIQNTSASTRTSGAIEFQSNSRFAGTGNITVDNASTAIDSTNVSKAGYVVFGGDANFTGNVNITRGVASINGNNKLGTAVAGNNVITIGGSGSDAALVITSAVTLPNNLVISSAAGTKTIAVTTTSATNTILNGTVLLNGNVTFQSETPSGTSATFAGVISGAGGITKTGAGTGAVNKTNTYFGATIVNAGTFVIAAGGSIQNTSGITVATGATLQSANGASTTRTLSLAEGSTLLTSAASTSFAPTTFTLNGDLTGGFTAVALNATSGGGLLKSGGAFVLTLSNMALGTYDLDGSSTGFSGVFGSVTLNGFSLATGDSGVTWAGSGGGFDYTFSNATNTLNVVPEPSTWILTALGLTFVVIARRRATLRG